MKIPKTLKIGAHIYKVLLVDGEDIEKDCGEQNPVRQVIKIRKDMPQTQKEEVLLHEIIHVINISLSEETVGFLSQALYQALKDNKLLRE